MAWMESDVTISFSTLSKETMGQASTLGKRNVFILRIRYFDARESPSAVDLTCSSLRLRRGGPQFYPRGAGRRPHPIGGFQAYEAALSAAGSGSAHRGRGGTVERSRLVLRSGEAAAALTRDPTDFRVQSGSEVVALIAQDKDQCPKAKPDEAVNMRDRPRRSGSTGQQPQPSKRRFAPKTFQPTSETFLNWHA
jgi:hypothetical protein